MNTIPPSLPTLHTIGSIAFKNHVPAHRVLYAILTLHLEAWRRAGNARVFDDGKVEAIEGASQRISKPKNHRPLSEGVPGGMN